MPSQFLFILQFVCHFGAYFGQRFEFRNPSLPISNRLDNLIIRLTTEELIGQLTNGGAGPNHGPAPAIKRLGVGPYQWRTNPLQGDCTVFCPPINQAASFDRCTVYEIGLASGMEIRAKYNEFSRLNYHADNTGINVFAPIVNVMRHPLWGRNYETYGEDPFMIGELAKAYVYGVGGRVLPGCEASQVVNNIPTSINNQPLMVGATCKHFAAHDGPENYPASRLSFEASVSAHDMWLTYFPGFRACLEAGAVGVMCAYSGINGTPDCVNPWLLNTVLREKWKFSGFVISDEGALQFLRSKHRFFANDSQAAYAAIKAGVNLENALPSSLGVYHELKNLIDVGKISHSDLVGLVRPLFLTRMLQGEFDPPEMDPYRYLYPGKLIHSDYHEHLALITAARTVVLLKCHPRFLPFQPDPNVAKRPFNHVLLIGPFSTNTSELYGGYDSNRQPQYEIPLSKAFEDLTESLTAADICIDGGNCTNYEKYQLQQLMLMDDLDLVIITIGTGFRFESEGHDRIDLHLPHAQSNFLVDALDMAAGRGVVRHPPIPVVVLIFSPGPVDISPAVNDDNVKAIFWCGYLNAAAGDVMLRLLLGNPGRSYLPNEELPATSIWHAHSKNEGYWWIPAARLPFTWYASIDNLAKITNYNMTNQTYRYLPRYCINATCPIPVLYPFGYGLTYNLRGNNFLSGLLYRNLILPSQPVSRYEPITVYATVYNQGVMACDEVVQLYIQWLDINGDWKRTHNFTAPNIQLAGFQRVSLSVGEHKEVIFRLDPDEHLSVWSHLINSMVAGTGTLRITVGGQQPYQTQTVGSNLLDGIVQIYDIFAT